MGNVVRERDDSGACFSTIRLDSGEVVMASIASGELKIFRMIFAGLIPTGIIWGSNDSDVIASHFFNPTSPDERPLAGIRNRILAFASIDALRRQLSAGVMPSRPTGVEVVIPPVFDLANPEHVLILNEISAAYSAVLSDERGPYATCMFKPSSLLPYPKPTIERAIRSLLLFAEGHASSPLLDSTLRSPRSINTLYACFDSLQDFLDVNATRLPSDPQENLRVGQLLRPRSE